MSSVNKTKNHPCITLWFENGEVNYADNNHLLSVRAEDFVKENKDLMKQIIAEKSNREITIFPVAINQKVLWLHSQLYPENISYSIAIAGRIKNIFKIDIFRKALRKLIERHILLRTVFLKSNSPEMDVFQVVTDSMSPYIEEIDVAGFNENQLKKVIYEKYRIPFDLGNGPLLKTYIFYNEGSTYFLFNIHHIICDAWALKIFITELFEYYDVYLKGEEPFTEPLVYDYSDYVSDQYRIVAGEDGNRMLNYWKNALKDKATSLILPYNFERPSLQTFNGSTSRFSISGEIYNKFSDIVKRLDSTPNIILFTLFELLLSGLSGQKEFIIGVPSKGRTKEDHMKVFGYMVSMLPVDYSFMEGKSFPEYIAENKAKLKSAVENQEIPFPSIVESLPFKRDLSMPPVFQVVFNFMNRKILGSLYDLWKPDKGKYTKLGSFEIRPYLLDHQEGQFDLTLEILQDTDEMNCIFRYNSDLFSPRTIEHYIEQYLGLISQAISDPFFIPAEPRKPADHLSQVSDEVKNMIDTVNATDTPYSEDKSIIGLFEERVSADPDRTAIVFKDGSLTYSELNEKADKLAGVLRSGKIGDGEYVGILLKRSPELIISLLAILKTGAAYIPLNLHDPEARVLSIIETAGLKHVITNTENKLVVPDYCRRMNIEQLINRSQNIPVSGKTSPAKSISPAYVIFTSGTTGTPKGVHVNHRSVINLIEWVNRTFKISYNDKLLWTTNLSFDLSVYDIFGILAAGAIVRIADDDTRLDPKKLYKLMVDEGITFWDSAPQSLVQVSLYFNGDEHDGSHNSLRLVFLSGDWIPLSLPGMVTSFFPSAVVVGLGGATEATIWSNYFIIDKTDPGWKSIPYGKPIQNARYYILDNRMEHCGVLQPGDLYIGGDCLATGYFNDPVLTGFRFIPDPYNEGSRLYMTGDKAQWLPDGNIEFLGRDDEQVKVRGYRIEIGEIKNAVLNNKSIKEAVIIPDKSDRHDIKIILFITTHNSLLTVDVKEFRKELRRSLPDYMIPHDIVQYAEFPSTSNGKIDSAALLSEYLKSRNTDSKMSSTAELSDEIKSMTAVQHEIFNVWRDTLETEKISLTDNFFDIGGNSLLAISTHSKIESIFKVDLGLRTFFENPRIRDLAETVEIALKRVKNNKEVKIILTQNGSGILRGEI